MFRLLVLYILLFSALFSEPMKATAAGDYMKIQHAGFIGYIAVGAGEYSFDKKLETELFYGYVPRYLSGIEIHTLTLKNSYVPFRYGFKESEVSGYLGLGVMYMPKQRYLANSREEVPSNYYHVTGLHALPYAGISYKREFKDESLQKKALSFYIEIGTLDSYLVSYFNNQEYLGVQDIYSLAIGVGYHY